MKFAFETEHDVGDKLWAVEERCYHVYKKCTFCKGDGRVVGIDKTTAGCPKCYSGLTNTSRRISPFELVGRVEIKSVSAALQESKWFASYATVPYTSPHRLFFKTKQEAQAFVAKRNKAKCRRLTKDEASHR